MGVCYYPEHWPESRWPIDAAEMRARGITRVRIGEFAWTLMEPRRGRYDWGWLDRVVAVLGDAGLGVVLGTPTATPPAWLVAELPEILPVGANGQTKGFGSRRYYTFSSARYRAECVRIARAMAGRYGRHPAVVGWQIDNEYGCHDTTYSYGPVDLAGFRAWTARRYGTVERLNAAWGAVVWSQQVGSFDEVGLPVATPYDPSPAKLLDYRRYASEQVKLFHDAQVQAIRPSSPGRFVTTNFMGNFTEFDHYPIGDAIDFASWDSYPLGIAAGRDDPRWDRTGYPDITAWNHDVMRAISPAPFWIMEQQPGAVNWARYNPVPMPGMVRLWAWEAFAHGAAVVSHFRWRQGQIGQEQMHAGLNLPDGTISVGGREAAQVAREIAKVGPLPPTARGDVALVFDYQTVWMAEIQPNGAGQQHLDHVQSWYAALRGLGLDVDIVRPGADLAGYRLVVVPSVWIVDDALRSALERCPGTIVIGPRTGSKTADFAIPPTLPPGPLGKSLPVRVTQVAALRAGTAIPVVGTDLAGSAHGWREWLDTALPVLARYDDGEAAVVGSERRWYVGCRGDATFTRALMKAACVKAGLTILPLPDHVRLRRRGDLQFAFNYGPQPWNAPVDAGPFLLGGRRVEPCSLAIWRAGRGMAR
ncbi:beta-galactosidase [Sphingomonas sp. CFBP 8760]|nr:beta-galactosidase [Sphingomonas sp. CFBP 8760]